MKPLHQRIGPATALVSFILAGLSAAPACFAVSAAAGSLESRLGAIDQVAAAGPFKPEWSSLETYQVPEWYVDGKFGIFIHWGPYSVPAFHSEWYPNRMYQRGSADFQHHVATYGPQSRFGYKDFIPMFKGEKFDPNEWVTLFRKAGARFVVPVADFHDGFAMWDSGLTPWNAVKMGPKRDVIGELAAATRAQGLVFGVSSHRAENWFFFGGGKEFDSDVRDPRYDGLYGPAQPRAKSQKPELPQPDKAFLDDWLARTAELVDKYQPQLVWFDWWIREPAFKPYLQEFAAFYYNRGAEWNRGVAINFKNDAMPARAAVLDIERGQLGGTGLTFWQTDTAVGKTSWCYITNHDYKTAGSLVTDLVDIVSKNGALLLDVGPRPDGTIPEPEQQILLEIGRWLSVNGEAIYGTRPWRGFGEGPTEVVEGSYLEVMRQPFTSQDIRFTTKDGALFAVALAWPADGKVIIKSLGSGSRLSRQKIRRVEMLGSKHTLKWNQDPNGLVIEVPPEKPCEHAFTFKISPVDRPATLDESLALGCTAVASDVHQNLLGTNGADKAVDGRLDTRWASESLQGSWLELDLGKPATFDQVWIDEWKPIVGKASDPGMRVPRIRSFELQYKDGETWKTFYRGTKIGTGFRCFFDPVTARVVRLNLLDGLDPAINEFHVFAPVSAAGPARRP